MTSLRGAQLAEEKMSDTPSNDAAIVAAYQAGTKTKDILDEFGISRSSLYWILQRNGIEPSRQRRDLPPAVAGVYRLDEAALRWFQEEVMAVREELQAIREDLDQAVQRQDTELQNQANILSLLATMLANQQQMMSRLLDT